MDELLEWQDPAKVLCSDGLVGDLKKALAERMLNAEMDVHLGGENVTDRKDIVQYCAVSGKIGQETVSLRNG